MSGRVLAVVNMTISA